MIDTRETASCFIHGDFYSGFPRCPKCAQERIDKQAEKCANCDHPRSAHVDGHSLLIDCVALGTSGDDYCTCNGFEEPPTGEDLT